MLAQAPAQFFDMRHMKYLTRGDITKIDAVIAIAHRMPFKAGKGDEAPAFVRRVGRRQIVAPGGARPLEALPVIFHQVAERWIILWHIVPVAVQGDADEIQLQARVMQRLIKAAFAGNSNCNDCGYRRKKPASQHTLPASFAPSSPSRDISSHMPTSKNSPASRSLEFLTLM